VYQIVGVIPDTQYNSIRGEVPPMAFAPAAQYPAPKPWTMMVIHSSAPSTTVIHEVKAKLGETHPEIVAAAGDLQEWIRNGLVRERLLATLSGFFGALAALLAIIGLYGVISYMMARRRTEIGIRMALGAVSADVLRMVLRETCWLVIAGIAIGTGFALVAGQWANSLLFHLNGHDPVTLAMAAALLFVIALVASFLPAWRASRVDPMLVLRYE
jgi:ABC-type antimicrobial peptide transport system permease subunit